MAAVSTIFSALGDATRLQIIEMLMRRAMPAGEVASAFDSMSRPAVVKHLNILRAAGLIETKQKGRERINSISEAGLAAAAKWFNGQGMVAETASTDETARRVHFNNQLMSDKPSKLLTARKYSSS